jgi:AraC-like DNA-binding protein
MEEKLHARESDSSLVEKIWYAHSERAGSFTSTAEPYWEMVVTKRQGETIISMRGPETIATPAEYLPNAEHVGIVFKLGTFMPNLPLQALMNRNDLHLPESVNNHFSFNGSSWEFPSFDNADVFIERLAREGLLMVDPVVDAALQGHPLDLSLRSIQNHFVRATGLTHKTIQQIDRAKTATSLLQQGVPILDTVFEMGYYDQPHLTRALKRFMGTTPAQIAQAIWPE